MSAGHDHSFCDTGFAVANFRVLGAGVSGAIADSACGYAAHTLMPAGSSVLTVEYKLNLLAPAEGDELTARARVNTEKYIRWLQLTSRPPAADIVFAIPRGWRSWQGRL